LSPDTHAGTEPISNAETNTLANTETNTLTNAETNTLANCRCDADTNRKRWSLAHSDRCLYKGRANNRWEFGDHSTYNTKEQWKPDRKWWVFTYSGDCWDRCPHPVP
jgi:hypothetical protein